MTDIEDDLPLIQFVDRLEDAVMLADPNGVVLRVNARGQQFFSHDCVGQLLGQLLNMPGCHSQDGGVKRFEARLQSGRALEVALSWLDWKGALYCMASLRDLTRQNLLRDALQESELRLSEMVGNLPISLFQMTQTTQDQFFFPYISRGALLKINVDPEDVMSEPAGYFSMLSLKDRVRALRAFKDAGRLGNSVDMDFKTILPDGESAWFRLFAHPKHDKDGHIRWDGAILDVTAQKELDSQIRRLAYYDQLTQLPNRLALQEFLRDVLKFGSGGEPFVLMALAIDRLDLVNDTLGNETAERLIRTVADFLLEKLPSDTFLCHPREDGFVIVLEGKFDEPALRSFAENILGYLKMPFEIGAKRLDISVCMGISQSYKDGQTIDELIMNAETALRRAHLTSPGGYRFYSEEMNARALRVLAYENRLRKAIAQEEFVPFFQPLVDISDGSIKGMEALVRWKHPRLGLISPGEFVPVAEEAGLIGEICHQVLYQTCRTAKQWIDSGYNPVPISVNISWRQFAQPERLLSLMNVVLEDTGLPADMLELELTESSVMEEPDSAIKTLNDLRSFGVMSSIDDFGTGYSSLAYLKRLPISKLKIDRAFIMDATENSRDAAIIDAIVLLAKALGLKTVAEGVETAEQLAFLKEKGCDLAQGFYFSRPIPAQDMEKNVARGFFSLTET